MIGPNCAVLFDATAALFLVPDFGEVSDGGPIVLVRYVSGLCAFPAKSSTFYPFVISKIKPFCAAIRHGGGA